MPSAAPLIWFWLLYMAGLGLVFPYQALYFSDNAGLTGAQVGMVLAMRPLMGLFFQPLWGQVADRSGRRGEVLALLCVGTAIGYLLLPLASGFAAVAAAMGFAAAFSAAVLPMGTSVSLAALAPNPQDRFGRVRTAGTVGFLALVLAFPWLLESGQSLFALEAEPGGPKEPGLHAIFWLAGALSLGGAIAAWRIPRHGDMGLRSERGGLRMLLRHGPYLRVLAFTFLAYFLLNGPINFMPLLVEDRGGHVQTVSRLWIAMLALEIPLVMRSGVIQRRLGPRGLVALGVGADGLRWLGCIYAPSLAWMWVFQLLHGVVVVGLIIGVALYVELVVPERLRSTGQTVAAMVGVCMASVLSSTVMGALSDRFGIDVPYLLAGIGAIALAALVPVLLPKAERPETPTD